MIATWMLYTVFVSLLLFASAIPADFICRALGRPTRFVWCAALLASLGLSGAALCRLTFADPERAPTGETTVSVVRNDNALPVAPLADVPRRESQVARLLVGVRAAFNGPDRFLSWLGARGASRVDAALGTGAAAAAVGSLCWLIAVAIRVRRITDDLEEMVLDGHRVLVSPDTGPSLVGIVRARMVVPRWLLAIGEPQRRVILAHEQQHAAAFDPALLAAGAALLALEVWNVALWGIIARLRAAIESDCDQRVVRAHGNPREYGEVLLAVYEQNTLGKGTQRQLAFIGRQSSLERRIRRVVETAPRLMSVRGGLGALTATLLSIAACETSSPTRMRIDTGATAAHVTRRAAPVMTLATTQPRCLNGTPDFDELKLLARQRHPELFDNTRADGIVIGLVLNENCALQRDTVVRAFGGIVGKGPDPYLRSVFGDTTGFARPRGMIRASGNAGRVTIAFAVKPSADWNARVAGTQCGFGLRIDEVCSWNGPLVIRMVDSVRALIAIRGFNLPNQPVDRLFLVTLSRPVPDLHSQSMRHAIVSAQGGTVYVEDFLATQPLLLFAPSSSTGLPEKKQKRDVRIIRDLIGVAQYGSTKLTLEQVERLRLNPSCDGPRGSCYQVDGITIEFPA